MNASQIGRFTVDTSLIRQETDMVAQIFGLMKCVPVRAEMRFDVYGIEYTAIADCFDPVPEGGMTPRYKLQVTSDKAGHPVNVLAIRV